MKAGLFECDHVDAAYLAEFGDYPAMFARLFPELEWRCYDVVNGHFPADLAECAVYFTTGSRRSVYEREPWIERMLETIRAIAAADRYFIGVCFGHQLLGEAMGGRVGKSPAGWGVGVHPFTILQREPWMQPWQPELNLLMMCQDQVLTLPPEATVLAAGPQCPVGIFRVGERMLGIQAHPEFSPAYDRLLLEKRRERIGEAVVEMALHSFEREVHRETIRRWVLRFVGRGIDYPR